MVFSAISSSRVSSFEVDDDTENLVSIEREKKYDCMLRCAILIQLNLEVEGKWNEEKNRTAKWNSSLSHSQHSYFGTLRGMGGWGGALVVKVCINFASSLWRMQRLV